MSYQSCIDKDFDEICQRDNDEQTDKKAKNDKEILTGDK